MKDSELGSTAFEPRRGTVGLESGGHNRRKYVSNIGIFRSFRLWIPPSKICIKGVHSIQSKKVSMASSASGTPLSLLCISNPTASSKTLFHKCGEGGRLRFRSFCPAEERKPSGFRPICCSSGENSRPSGDNSLSFCIIEGPETVKDFVQMQLQEIEDNIRSRRDKIFLLMEEVRRLRIQQRIRSAKSDNQNCDENEMPDMPSTMPFVPNMTPKTMKQLHLTSFSIVSGIIVFGGFLAPILELKLGLGGTS